MSRKIYVVGAHSTGKTTLARFISEEYKLPLIAETARAVLAEGEVNLKSLRADLKAIAKFQRDVFKHQLAAERRHKSFVADRAFDFLAYSAYQSLIASSFDLKAYYQSLRRATIFFVRPQKELLTEDGVRYLGSWEEIISIDAMIKFILESNNLNYVSINSVLLSERARTVRAVIAQK